MGFQKHDIPLDCLVRFQFADKLMYGSDTAEAGINLSTLETAFVLAAARRSLRSPDAPPFVPIRSMHYFLPVSEEILDKRPAEDLIRGYSYRGLKEPISSRRNIN
jgi:hypothetical protein